jgi:hypothetical protein
MLIAPHGADMARETNSFRAMWVITGIMVAVAMASFMWSGLGFRALFQQVQDSQDGELEEPTLQDYDAVESLEIANGTIVVTTDSNPKFASSGTVGRYEVTHLEIVREDGYVNERVEWTDGVRIYRFNTSNGVDGNYTLSLVKHFPEDPGLFGSPERYEKQHVEFSVDNGELTVTSVPWAAKYDDSR